MNDLLTQWEAIGRPRILVMGDLILDRYTWGNAERVSPEAPVVVLRADTHEARLGGAASVAGLLSELDAEVVLAGVVGDDAGGRVLRRLLTDAEIDDRLVLCDPSRPTTTKERFIGRAAGRHPHQILRVDDEVRTPLDIKLQSELLDRILERLPEFQAVLISDYDKGVCKYGAEGQGLRAKGQNAPSAEAETHVFGAGRRQPPGSSTIHPSLFSWSLLHIVLRAAEDWGIPVIVDPARLPDYGGYDGALVLKPNRIEAELASGIRIVTPQDAIRAGDVLCERLGLQAAVITLDRDGMVLCQPGRLGELFSTNAREVYDITGAGDMALAMLGLVLANPVAHLSGRPATPLPVDVSAALPGAVRLANIASGLEVQRWGVAPICRHEIKTELLGDSGPGVGKIVSLDEMAALAERYRRYGRTVVFTNGCFDLLHVGHLGCLQQAAQQGDVLVVAINSDDSVRRLKGPDRPVVRDTDRAALVAALGCVDHVLIFAEPTPHTLLERIRPDVLVKGGTTPDIVGREVVESYGGRACVMDCVRDVSTTKLLEKTAKRISKPSGKKRPRAKPQRQKHGAR